MTQTTISAIRKLLGSDRRIAAVFLLGSAVRDRLRPDSDVDLAVLPESGIQFSAAERMKLIADLSAVLTRDVDIAILSTDNLIYAKEAYLTGECIVCRNAARRDLFGATALGEYLDLRRERREVEDAFRTG